MVRAENANSFSLEDEILFERVLSDAGNWRENRMVEKFDSITYAEVHLRLA